MLEGDKPKTLDILILKENCEPLIGGSLMPKADSLEVHCRKKFTLDEDELIKHHVC